MPSEEFVIEEVSESKESKPIKEEKVEAKKEEKKKGPGKFIPDWSHVGDFENVAKDDHPVAYFDFTKPNLFELSEKDDEDKFPVKVSKKEKINHDSYIFDLEFDSEWISGLWPGAHYVWHAEIDGKM
jgi:hypothetical protein